MMKKSSLALALVSLILVAYLLSSVDINQLGRTIASANPWLVLAGLACEAIALALKSERWRVLLNEKMLIPAKELFPIQVAGIAVSNFSPGKMLEAVKVVP